MNIEPGKYSVKSLCEEIIESEGDVFSGYHYNQIKAYFYLIEENKWQNAFDSAFEVKEYGEVLRIESEYRDRAGERQKATFFVGEYDDSGNILTVLTAETEEAIEQTLSPVTEYSDVISPMPIVPGDFERMNNLVLSKYEDIEITRFKARRIPDLAEAEVRPYIDRTIEYKGRDGKQALAEMRDKYGVVPVRIEYEHSEVVIRIDTTGKFTLRSIGIESFELLFELVNEVIENVLKLQEITKEIRFEREEKTEGDFSITVPEVSAGEIAFSKEFTLRTAEDFIEGTEDREDMAFSFTDISAEAGSLDFSAQISDDKRNAVFNVSATESSMKIIPKHDCSFPSLIEFYLCFVQSVDQGAEMQLYEQQMLT